MLFAITALVLAQALAIQANVFHKAAAPATDVEALCAGKVTELTALSQLKEVAAKPQFSEKCPAKAVEAAHELVALIEGSKDNLCSVDSINKLRTFYHKYLDSSSQAESTEKLPKSLERFGLAYGLQMSNLCKKNMVKVLSEKSAELLTPEDFKQINNLVDENSPTAEMLKDLAGPDEIFVPGDLAPFVKHGFKNEKLFMQTATGSYIKNLQSVCQHRFKPIYEPLMMPLVQLSNMGFNYKDEPLKYDLKSPAAVREVGKWSRIVFLCEALGNIHIVEDANDKELAEGGETRLVRLVTPEEAAAIEGKQVAASETSGDFETAVYEPAELVSLGDLVYDRTDKKLHSAVKSFKTSRSEEENIKKRMLSKAKAILKSEIKAGHVGFLVSTAFKGLFKRMKGDPASNPSTSLVKMLDEIVESEGNHLDSPVSQDFQVRGTIVLLVVSIALLAFMTFIIIVVISMFHGSVIIG